MEKNTYNIYTGPAGCADSVVGTSMLEVYSDDQKLTCTLIHDKSELVAVVPPIAIVLKQKRCDE